MLQPSTASEMARELVEQLPTSPREGAQLQAIAERLRVLATSAAWQHAPYREAAAGEELLYELAMGPRNGPSLYLVSDGVGVISPPHCHKTWAVIAGIRGQELNHRYTVNPIDGRTVIPAAEVDVGSGQVLVLGNEDIHSTEVRGVAPTYHLHLYGRPLHELPAFASRRYLVARP
jgi:predicted metal-dependent enzyme (double-stranded beta helix superfamily)